MSTRDATFSIEPPTGVPRRVRLGGQWFRVRRVIDGWMVRSRWWADDEERLYVRLETDGPVLEAYRHDGTWALSRILD